jgi:hypothetical protein
MLPQDGTKQGLAEHPAVKTTNQARQGVTGHNVRYVLGFGLVGVVVAFAIIYLVYFS